MARVAWHSLPAAPGTPLEWLDVILREQLPPDSDVVHPAKLLLFSDFSESETHETFSFLAVAADEVQNVVQILEAFRAGSRLQEAGAGVRHIKYERLADGIRRRDLPAFLAAASTLPGALVTFCVSKRAMPLLPTPSRDMIAPELLAAFDTFKVRMWPRLNHVAWFASLLCAGFSGGTASVHWVCDQDALTASDKHQEALAALTVNAVCSFLRAHDFELTISVDAEEALPVVAEDFVSICDLAAGAYAALSASDNQQVICMPEGIRIYPSLDYAHKSILVLDHFRLVRGRNLSEIMISIESNPMGSGGLLIVPKSYEF